MGQRAKKVIYKGQKYSSYTSLGKAFGLTYNCCKSRLAKGTDLSIPAGIRATGNVKPVKYKGVAYKSIKALALAYGLVPNTLCGRLKRGMTIKEAMTFSHKSK